MIEINTEITDEWRKPSEGYDKNEFENNDSEITQFGMECIDKYYKN